ncbi:MAG: zf-HC2 domain-containing protein [Desulfobacterales bacterium]|nr:zf-HC2 domain-containing protein [Desulfobacterales bacterium]
MKCQEVSKALVAYLDGEVTPSERTLIQAHLAECDACQEEMTALSALQSRVSQALQVRAAQAVPSPQAWSHLQARLAGEVRPVPSWLSTRLQRLARGVGCISQTLQLKGGVTMKKGFTLAAIAALIIAISTVVFVPSVRTEVGKILNAWFRFETPGGKGEVALLGPAEFTPLHPAYVPDEIQGSVAVINSGESGSRFVELTYHNGEQFVAITQSKTPPDKSLPAGQETTVNGQPATLVTELRGTFEYGFRIPKNAQVETFGTPLAERISYHGPITYENGKQLTWYAGDVKVEMFSNLTEEEMLKIAESLVPAEAGEPPFQSLNLPSGGEGRVVIIQKGPAGPNP